MDPTTVYLVSTRCWCCVCVFFFVNSRIDDARKYSILVYTGWELLAPLSLTFRFTSLHDKYMQDSNWPVYCVLDIFLLMLCDSEWPIQNHINANRFGFSFILYQWKSSYFPLLNWFSDGKLNASVYMNVE